MEFKYVKKQLKFLIFYAFCSGFFAMITMLFLRYPSQITTVMWFIIVPMGIGSMLGVWQTVSMYRNIKVYISPKCLEE